MRKKEANFQTTFNHWLKNVYKRTGAFELKQTQTDSLPFSDVQEHQIQALQAVRHGTGWYRYFRLLIPEVDGILS